MNRKERRNLKEEINIFSDVVTIIKQYFPELINKVDNLTVLIKADYICGKQRIPSSKSWGEVWNFTCI